MPLNSFLCFAFASWYLLAALPNTRSAARVSGVNFPTLIGSIRYLLRNACRNLPYVSSAGCRLLLSQLLLVSSDLLDLRQELLFVLRLSGMPPTTLKLVTRPTKGLTVPDHVPYP